MRHAYARSSSASASNLSSRKEIHEDTGHIIASTTDEHEDILPVPVPRLHLSPAAGLRRGRQSADGEVVPVVTFLVEDTKTADVRFQTHIYEAFHFSGYSYSCSILLLASYIM